jgi:hypothetical protein
MKKIEITNLESISGGGFWDGFCGGVTAVGASMAFAGVVVAPAAAVVLGLTIGGCFVAGYR